MIYDCFTYNGEESVLLLRWHELLPIENLKHVIVQADKTFTGNDKNIINYDNNDRMIPVYVTDMPEDCDAWTRETHQRNAIIRGLINAKDDDIIIISDVDEIPRLQAIKTFTQEMGLAALRMDNFWYKFNCLTERQTWLPAKIMTFKYLKNKTPNQIRNSGHPNIIDNGGWHFSYLGDADYIINKIKSFSHQEFNTDALINKGEIERKINEGISLWGNSKFEFIPIDETFPKYLFDNQDKFKHLIKTV